MLRMVVIDTNRGNSIGSGGVVVVVVMVVVLVSVVVVVVVEAANIISYRNSVYNSSTRVGGDGDCDGGRGGGSHAA